MTSERVSLAYITERLKTQPIVRPALIVPIDNGFKLDGWKTPDGVVLGTKDMAISPERLGWYLALYCKSSGYGPEGVIVGENGVLQSIGIRYGEQTGYVKLAEVNPSGQGEYQLIDVTNGHAAVILQAILARYINFLVPREKRLPFPYLDTSTKDFRSYFPVDLRIPGFVRRTEQQLTDPAYQESLIKRAIEVAKKLGLTIHPRDGLTFRNGFLTHATVIEGNACNYNLDDSGSYGEHNVDTYNQAIALHWVCGTFIRELADKLSS